MVPKYQQNSTERSVVIQPDSRIGINDIEIRSIPAHHYDMKALGYLVQTPYYLLGYTSDTKYSESYARRFSNCNIIIFNCKFPSGIREGDHLNVDDVIAFLKICKPQLAVITHFGAKMLDADPLAQARKIHQETGVQIVAAKDGLHIAPSNYDVQQKQQKLNTF